MLDRFPLDVFDYFLEVACPPLVWPNYSRLQYTERHRTLLALSLVNKAIGRRSQKHLWEEVDYPGDEESWTLHAVKSKELVAMTKTLHAHTETSPRAVGESLAHFPSLKNVYLSSIAKPIDVRDFADCRGALPLLVPCSKAATDLTAYTL
jgi:hypothetical protein